MLCWQHEAASSYDSDGRAPGEVVTAERAPKRPAGELGPTAVRSPAPVRPGYGTAAATCTSSR